VITIGGCDPAVREALDVLESRGVHADFMRIRAFPFDDAVEEFLNAHEFCFVIEQNRDGQLCSLLTLETGIAKDKLRSIRVYGGFPLSTQRAIDEITVRLQQNQEQKDHAVHC